MAELDRHQEAGVHSGFEQWVGPDCQTGRDDQAVLRRPGHSWAGPCVAAAGCSGTVGLGQKPWKECFLSQPGPGVLWGEPMSLKNQSSW